MAESRCLINTCRMNEFLAMFQFSWLVRNLTLMNILTARAMHKGIEPIREGLSSFLEVWKDLEEGVTLWMEDHVFSGKVNPESVCSLNIGVLCTPGIWKLLVGSFNYFYWNNVCALNLLKLNVTSHTVNHKFWLASTSILLGHREAHGSHWSHLETRSKDPGPGSITLLLCVPQGPSHLCSNITPFTCFYHESPHILL